MKPIHPESEDFSMKWFGVPNKVVVAHWDRLNRLPKTTKEQFEATMRMRERIGFRHPAYIFGDAKAI